MKHPKPGGKAPPPPYKTAAASSSTPTEPSRKSRWESQPPSSDPKDTAPPPSSSSHLPPISPRSRPFHPLSGPPPPLHPDPAATAPPSYGFHNLDRRTIVLADGSVRSYFALPPDYPTDPPAPDRFFPLGPERQFPPPGPRFSPEGFREPLPFARGGPQHDYWSSLGLDGPRNLPEGGPRNLPDGGPRNLPDGGPSSMKRKYGEEDEFAWHRQHVLQYGNPNGVPPGSGGERGDHLGRGASPLRRGYYEEQRLPKQAKFGGEGFDDLPPRRGRPGDDVIPVGLDVDQKVLKRAYLKFVKEIYENPTHRKNFLEDGKQGPLKCFVCDRSSKDFSDVHGLILHAYNAQNAEMRVDHLGLHKALCVVMGWNYAKAPENSKAYQSLSADDAATNREDLILWPPTVIVHNTNSGRRKDGRMEGFGNKDMDIKLKELGFGGGKAKSIYGKDGHTGVTVVKFADTQVGLKEAERVAEYFEKDNHGRKGWGRAQASQSGDDDDKNPALVKLDEKTGEKKRIFYGYLATATDIEKVDHETKKKAIIKSRSDFDLSD